MEIIYISAFWFYYLLEILDEYENSPYINNAYYYKEILYRKRQMISSYMAMGMVQQDKEQDIRPYA